jgi:hypothetical protein
MSTHPQTIQIYLPSGDPRGIRIAALTTSIVQVIEVPRALLSEFQVMPESKQTGLYVLVGGEEEEMDQPLAYIGESGNVGKRLGQHHSDPKMDFWNRALVVISLTHSFTAAHTLYLEWSGIQKGTEAGRYVLKNGNGGTKPHTPPWLEADCRQIFEILRVLVATLGQPVFEPWAKPKSGAATLQNGSAVGADEPELFYCRSTAYDATAEYTSEGMVVLKGSKAKIETAPSSSSEKGSLAKMRKFLIGDGALKQEDDRLVFQRDVLFKSPSGASDAVTGASTSGWNMWKSKEGKTLDELKRKPMEQQ